MGLISPPKWPSVNPFFHPLGSKIGRKPMVNPSKWVNLKSNFLKFHHRNQAISGIEKARKMAYFRAFLALLSCRLSLAELRSATSGFEAVLLRKAQNCGVFNSCKKRHKSHIKRTLSRFLNARKFQNRVFWNADFCTFSYLFMPSCRQFVVRFPAQSSYFSIASASFFTSCSPYWYRSRYSIVCSSRPATSSTVSIAA